MTPVGEKQLSLFEKSESDKTLSIIDAIKNKDGRETIQLASSEIRKRWQMKADYKSPKYTIN